MRLFLPRTSRITGERRASGRVIALDQPPGPDVARTGLGSLLKVARTFEFKTAGPLKVGQSYRTYPRLERRSLLRSWRSVTINKSVERYIREHGRPDLIHAQSLLTAAPYAAKMSARFSIPWVYTEHFSGFLEGDAANQRFLQTRIDGIREALRTCSGGSAVSSKLANAVALAAGGPSPTVIANAIDTNFFHPTSSPSDRSSEPFVFCAIGTLRELKNYDGLIRAFAAAFPDSPDCKLVIGGDGPLREKLADLTNELGVASQVDFPGKLERADVRTILQRSDTLVSSSVVETFGVTLIEAMACGKPVLATRSGGPDTFVTPEVGKLVELRDHDSLVAGLRYMHRHARGLDASTIRNYAVDNFGPLALTRNLEEFYTRSLADSRQVAA